MATGSCSRKNEDRQEMNHQKPFLGRRELWKKQGVASPGLLQSQALQVPTSHEGIPDALFPLRSARWQACVVVHVQNLPMPQHSVLPWPGCLSLQDAGQRCMLWWLCHARVSSVQSFFAAVKSRKAELLHRAAVWFNCSRREGMVTASPCPARAAVDSVCV